jgi:hypothetical protein
VTGITDHVLRIHDRMSIGMSRFSGNHGLFIDAHPVVLGLGTWTMNIKLDIGRTTTILTPRATSRAEQLDLPDLRGSC